MCQLSVEGYVESVKHYHCRSKFVDEQKMNWIGKLFDLVLDPDGRRRIDCWVNYLEGIWISEDTTTSVANLQINKN